MDSGCSPKPERSEAAAHALLECVLGRLADGDSLMAAVGRRRGGQEQAGERRRRRQADGGDGRRRRRRRQQVGAGEMPELELPAPSKARRSPEAGWGALFLREPPSQVAGAFHGPADPRSAPDCAVPVLAAPGSSDEPVSPVASSGWPGVRPAESSLSHRSDLTGEPQQKSA